MSRREISLVVGTAGHIDHGKTQLVKAMTGIDCDRLNEEKKRGITIELGFAPLVLPSERVISLIDVPGHDRFIRQMVSGASGIDAALLVVAADEGVMPQTREHLDILSLLGVRYGLVAITKKDLVDDEMLEIVREDIMTLTAGTFLEDSPVIAVSAVTGEGVGELKAELDRLVDRVRPRDRGGAYFMPIDRAFTVAGFGTVVTGTAYKGAIAPGVEMDVWPSGRRTRVRSVQVHGRNVERGFAGQRVAACLSDVSLDEIKRGDVVCARSVYRATSCLDVMLKLLDFVPEPLEHWQRVHLHIGTADVLARVSMLEDKSLPPGHSAPVQLVLEEPVAVTLGQRFVIRFYSPLRTIGGGEVLLPYASRPSGKKHRDAERELLVRISVSAGRDERAAAMVAARGRLSVSELMILTQEEREELYPILERLESQKRVFFFKSGDGAVFSPKAYQKTAQSVVSAAREYHVSYPHRRGVAADELVSAVFAEEDRRMGRSFLDRLLEDGVLNRDGEFISAPGFLPRDDAAFTDARRKILDICARRGWKLPEIAELRAESGIAEAAFSNVLDQMKKNGDAAVLAGAFVLSIGLLESPLKALRSIEGGFTLAQARDVTGSSRKYILPVLEYLDGLGVTRRVGEKRIFIRKE